MRANTRLIQLLREQKLTLAFAESVTCGLAAHQLAAVRGTSDVLRGSIVCYHEDVKTCLLNVPRSIIQKYTAESQQTTDAVAKKLKKLIDADVHAAITGLASPGGSETREKPVGTIFYAVVYKNKIHRLRKRFYGSPLDIRKKACEELYRFIVRIVA
ncbi:MAG TPA: CinA family protein [Bacteroidia bacterium]|nr:CinA family protein [Bacteroidia bacterium]